MTCSWSEVHLQHYDILKEFQALFRSFGSADNLHSVQVLLRHMPDREPLVYACSWWKAGEVGQYLKDSSKPIWVSLSQERMELHRDIQFITLGHSPSLEE